jgi:hypothetical protein
MKALLITFALLAGQALTMQDKPVIHLKPHTNTIEVAFGGSLLELSQGPPVLRLPAHPPKPNSNGNDWTVDVKNFGPAPVTVVDAGAFSAPIGVNQTIHIVSNGKAYSLKY